MCGIVGYIGKKANALKVLTTGLSNLEYRGYDSAGVAFVLDNRLNIIKEKGKISKLKEKIDTSINSNIGIGHTRWATHGVPSKENSHPHRCGKITIVHNGIIENDQELKEELRKKGYTFNSETDTEVACSLLDYLYNKTNDINEAIKLFEKKAKGAYAIGLICDDDFNTLYAIKKNSPLIIGVNDDENYIASDVPAILEFTNKYIILEDGEFAKLTNNSVEVFDIDGKIINKDVRKFEGSISDIGKDGYDHYMDKEIHEQPDVIRRMAVSYTRNNDIIDDMPNLNNYKNITIVACGSAMHAGLIGKNLIETYGNIPVNVEIASDFRSKKLFIDKDTLVIAISQSGETADTLEAVKIAKEKGCDTLGIVNVECSSIARSVSKVLYTKAGPEISVATTKAYSAQVTLLSFLAYSLAKNSMDKDNLNEIKAFFEDLKELPNKMQKILDNEDKLDNIANDIYDKNDIFFIGRSIDYALCMEGSLKLKEISYIHSEAYQAGELKHGTISLIDDDTPVIAIVTDEKIANKTISNIKEVKARGAKVIYITTDAFDKSGDFYSKRIVVPKTNTLLQPLLTILPLQLIAYKVSKLRGLDVDKPRHLAKSVTVE